MTVPPFIKLNINFDAELLKQDLAIAEEFHKKTEVIGPYNDGSWSAIALRSNDGSVADVAAFNQGECKDTEVLDQCPYFKQVLQELGFASGVARLLFLPAGKIIGSHRDKNSWKNGYVRLHLPIVTHKDVTMVVDGKRQFMDEGELWFGDFSKLHSVENNSDIMRVHLVIDSYVSEGLLALLPDQVEKDIRDEEEILIIPDEKPSFTGDLNQYTGFYRAKQSPIPILGRVSCSETRLYMEIMGFPYQFSYFQVAENKFQHMNNVLKTLVDQNGEPKLMFNVDGRGMDDIRIDLFADLSLLDKVQWGLQRLLVKFGFFVFYSTSFFMKYVHKITGFRAGS